MRTRHSDGGRRSRLRQAASSANKRCVVLVQLGGGDDDLLDKFTCLGQRGRVVHFARAVEQALDGFVDARQGLLRHFRVCSCELNWEVASVNDTIRRARKCRRRGRRIRSGLHGRGLHRNSSRVRQRRRTRIQPRSGIDRRLRTEADCRRVRLKFGVRLFEQRTLVTKHSRFSLGVEGELRSLQQLGLEIVSDDTRLLFTNRLTNTVAREVVTVLTNGVNGWTRHARDGCQSRQCVSVEVEKVANPDLHAVAALSAMLDGVAGSEVELLGRHVLVVLVLLGPVGDV